QHDSNMIEKTKVENKPEETLNTSFCAERNRTGIEKDTMYNLKDANEVKKVVNKILSKMLVDNREEDSKQLNDRFDKALKKEDLEHAWPTRSGLAKSEEASNIG
ncbi:42775_t:CDS:2, partial [Gigaspora margarita]